MHDTNATNRLQAQHPMPPFTLPAAAFAALDAATREARIIPFAVSPCGAEKSTVLAVWLVAALNDDGTEADRTELLCRCPDFFGSQGGRVLDGRRGALGGGAVGELTAAPTPYGCS